MLKKICVTSINVLAWLYGIFEFFYGAIYVSLDLSQSIMFETAAEARAARKDQILYGTPMIIIGIIVMCALIAYYVLTNKQAGSKAWQAYSASVIGTGAAYLIASTVIAIYINQKALLLCIIPAAFLLLYGVYTAVKHSMKTDVADDKEDKGNFTKEE